MLKRFVILIRSLIFNLRVFPMRIALKMPIIIGRGVRCKKVKKGTIKLPDKISFGMIRIGVDGGTNIPIGGVYGYWKVDEGKVIFEGKATFYGPTSIIVNTDASIVFGKNFSANVGCEFFSDSQITFGDECLLGWRCSFHDGDGHKLIVEDSINIPKPIRIGNRVWIGAECVFVKGASVGDGCVVARNSLVTKSFEEETALFMGHPANVKRHNIVWRP